MSGHITGACAAGARPRPLSLPWLLLGLLIAAEARADAGLSDRDAGGLDAGGLDAGQRDAGTSEASTPRKPRIRAVTELLYSTTDVGRMHVRCRADPVPRADDEAKHDEAKHDEAKPDELLRCAFFTVSVAQRPAEKMATFGNYGEILRDMLAQCRTQRTRTEQARKACAACRKSLDDACLYVEAMKDLRKRCAAPKAAPHPNPAVRALEQADHERGQSATAITERFCAACREDPTAACFSSFWNGIEPPERCALKTASFEVALTRQSESATWIGNLGGTCNTQIALSYDEPARAWTYRQVQLTPEKCSAVRRDDPITYSSATQYAFSDLTVRCERMAFQ